MLTSALDHYRRQQRITAAGLVAARKAQSRGPVEVAKVVAAFQLLAARDAAASVEPILEEQGIDPTPVASLVATALIGVASDGRPLDTLFEQAQNAYAFGLMVATQLQDVARAAVGIGIVTRPQVPGYVRMLNPPSCSRCVVQAGKWFKWNAGFERHPRCDCRHIPATEDTAGDLRTDPNAYFESLSPAEQDRIFTNAGANAIRDGADIGRVVNARRGMSTAQINGRGWIPKGRLSSVQIGGREAFTTTESTTKRGLASRGRTGRNMQARLMPETIYAVAEDRADALRMLALHGYIIT